MSRFFFIALLILAQIIRGPLSIILIVLQNFFPSLKNRIRFERKNFLEEECRSFKKDHLIADYCFEVSSEGELEQVRPLIERFLQKSKRIEVLFASPSVENKCLKLARDNPSSVRVLRVPIATHCFLFQTAGGWITAPRIIFCRYDFFPELLILKFFGKKFILLSAAGKKPSWFKSQAHQLFDLIVAANAGEARYFKEHLSGALVFDFDFRIPRIFERIENADMTLGKVRELETYLSFLSARPVSSNLVMGSAWVSDLVVFNEGEWKMAIESGLIHLLVVPHDLKSSSIEEMKLALMNRFPGIPIYEISKLKNDFDPTRAGIVLLNLSGVLCEIYTRFQTAYVGGGFARSIHSVLEPFLSGARVFCGPKIHRSTEFDFINELRPEEIHLLNNPNSFYNLYIEQIKKAPDAFVRKNLQRIAIAKMDTIINEIEAC